VVCVSNQTRSRKRYQDSGFASINKCMEKNTKRYAVKAPSRGGAREGSGRPRGSTNKITLEALLANLDLSLGHSYAEQIAINYSAAIGREDWSGVRDYDRVLLGKVVADKLEVETVEGEDAVAAKAQAFAEALTALTQVNTKGK